MNQLKRVPNSIRRDIVTGLVIMSALMLIKLWFEDTMVGNVAHQALYNLVQLSPSVDESAADRIAVVDLAQMDYTRGVEHDLDFTSRDALIKVVDQIVAKKPCAVGIDLDFDFMIHPLGEEQRKADLRFLERIDQRYGQPSGLFECQAGDESALRKGHIFLGAHGAITLGKYVLGDPKFERYAAFVGFPNPKGDREPRTKMVQSVTVNENGETTPFPSLSAAIAGIPLRQSPLLSWALDRVSYVGNALPSAQFWLNYRPLEFIEKRQSVRYMEMEKRDFHAKFVLIGRGQDSPLTPDKYAVPGRGETHAGVYIHACAIYTLLTNGLIALSGKGEIVLDILATLCVLAGVAFYSWRRAEQTGRYKKRVSWVATLIASGLVFAFALLLAHLGSGVLWDGFALVVVTLWVHLYLENEWERALEWFEHHFLKVKNEPAPKLENALRSEGESVTVTRLERETTIEVKREE